VAETAPRGENRVVDKRSVEAIIGALNGAGVRYLIVGGVAVVAHGYVRFTADLDLVLDLRDDNLRRAVEALADQGYRPRAPVPLEDFLNAEKRAQWVKEKQLTVFSLDSPRHPRTEVDLFVEAPFDFDTAFAEASVMELAPGLTATFVSYDGLLQLKNLAGRPTDLEDVVCSIYPCQRILAKEVLQDAGKSIHGT
jgi:hypothetical protein